MKKINRVRVTKNEIFRKSGNLLVKQDHFFVADQGDQDRKLWKYVE